MIKKEKLKMAVEILIFFLKIGFFTFGGGWSILTQMQKEFVERRRLITEEELLDITVVGRSLPGMMITNISMLFGYHVGGILCGFTALIGIVLPSLIILSLVAIFYDMVKDNSYAAHALVGIRAAVVPIIGSAAFKMRKSAFKSKISYGLAVVAFAFCLFSNVSIGIIVLFAAFAGVLTAGRIEV